MRTIQYTADIAISSKLDVARIVIHDYYMSIRIFVSQLLGQSRQYLIVDGQSASTCDFAPR